MADYYDILGVSKGASDDEIKKAFRKKAHEYHPDKDGGDEAKFKEVNAAYQVLSNKEKRAQYDQFGQTFDGAGPGGGAGAGGFDFSQFGGAGGQGFEFNFGEGGFGDIFGEAFGGGRGARNRGRDIQVRVTISFAEMITGVKKDITLRKSIVCEHCEGSGGEPGSAEKTCETCKGQGHVEKVMRTMLGNFAQRAVCDTCHGKGKVYETACKICGGSGHINKEVTETVEIPAGIENGQTVALTGKGEAGEHGAPAGDLLVTVNVTPDARFVREGNNINSDVHISFAQAALSDKIPVETVHGSVTMKIPAGTQSGEVFRIRNKGVPRLQGIGSGDHMVTVIVDVPTKLSRKQKKIIEQLRDEK